MGLQRLPLPPPLPLPPHQALRLLLGCEVSRSRPRTRTRQLQQWQQQQQRVFRWALGRSGRGAVRRRPSVVLHARPSLQLRACLPPRLQLLRSWWEVSRGNAGEGGGSCPSPLPPSLLAQLCMRGSTASAASWRTPFPRALHSTHHLSTRAPLLFAWNLTSVAMLSASPRWGCASPSCAAALSRGVGVPPSLAQA